MTRQHQNFPSFHLLHVQLGHRYSREPKPDHSGGHPSCLPLLPKCLNVILQTHPGGRARGLLNAECVQEKDSFLTTTTHYKSVFQTVLCGFRKKSSRNTRVKASNLDAIFPLHHPEMSSVTLIIKEATERMIQFLNIYCTGQIVVEPQKNVCLKRSSLTLADVPQWIERWHSD